jgi:hypothetical protein
MATIYLMLDNRLGTAGGGKGVDPDLSGMPWVATMGFTDTGYDVGINESGDGDIDQYFSIFKAAFPAGTVILQGSEAGHGGNMYGIAVGPPPMTASSPVPDNGATIDGYVYPAPPYNVYTPLDFSPGFDAVSHEVFFSGNRSDVEARDPCVSLGEAPDMNFPTQYFVGIPIPDWTPYTDSLVRGTWYYWCADETDSNDVVWEGPIWSFYIRLEKASSPNPADGRRFVSLTPTLSWASGSVSGTQDPHVHDIYFGTSFTDVNLATLSDPEFMVTQAYIYETWDPNLDGGLTLTYGTDYYWRIDEVHGRVIPFPGEVKIGDVWTFKTMPLISVTDPNLTAWWRLDEGEGDLALDWSGHGNHGTLGGDPEWVGGMIGDALDLGGVGDYVAIQNLNYAGPNHPEVTVCAWIRTSNSNDKVIASFDRNEYWRLEINGSGAGPGQVGWDVRTDTGQVDYGSSTRVDDGLWRHVAGVFDNGTLIIYIDGNPEPSASGGSTFGTGTTRYGFLGVGSEASSFDGNKGPTNYFDGDLDDFRIYDVALSQGQIIRAASPPEAWSPYPSDGDHLVDPAEFVECTWRAGGDALQHYVYFGTDPNALAGPFIRPLAEANYTPAIDFEQTYYWRVDEVNGTDVVTGDEWTFSTVREAGLGSILGESFLNITNPTDYPNIVDRRNLDIFKSHPNYPDHPDVSYEVPSFDSGQNLADDYGGRLHGWLIPDTTGDYRFWLTTDDPGELYLNVDGADPSGAELIAYIANNNWSGPYQWDKYATQDSNDPANVGGLIHLEADQRYYICAIWKEGDGGDHCMVAWQGPDQPDAPVNGSADAVIDGYYLMPFTRLWASNPKPRHRQDISADEVTLLSWKPGIHAATHDVYFGTSLSDVNESATPVSVGQPRDVNTFDPTIALGGPIEWERIYYWRIDEANSATSDVWTGGIWWFRTTNFAVLDDFEPYDKAGPSTGDPNALRYVWKDGWSFFVTGVKSGSNVMLAGLRDEFPRPYLHYDDFHGGNQGLAIYYDNDGNTSVPGWPSYVYAAPKYSEVEASTTGIDGLGIGQDWTRQGIMALSLWFKGYPNRAGSAVVSGVPPYTATLISDGLDIWDVGPNPYHDEFHYAYQSLEKSGGFGGYGEVMARVDDINNITPEATHGWAKAGVMMRETLLPDSNHVMVVVTPGSGVSLQFRDQKRGASTERTVGGPTPPHWVKLARDSFGIFSAYHANDVNGVAGTWYTVTAQHTVSSIPMDPNIYVGLCLTSHSSNGPDPNLTKMCQADFSGVNFTAYTGSAVVGPWQSQDIGIISNDAEPLYLALEDIFHNVGVKYHDNPNAALLWQDFQEWNIDLADSNFSIVDMNYVDKVYIGLGDRVAQPTGGSGVVYVDDIRLNRARFVPGMYPSILVGNIHRDADGLFDGVVDEKDLNVMAGYWLETDEIVLTTAPIDTNLLVHWAFEEGSGVVANDSTINNNDGVISGAAWSSSGYDDANCLEFSGTAVQEVNDADANLYLDGLDAITISVWVKSDVTATDKGFLIMEDPSGGDNRDIRYDAVGANGDGVEVIKMGLTIAIDDVNTSGLQLESSEYVQTTEWQHLVMTWSSGNQLALYINGLLDTPTDNDDAEVGTTTGCTKLLVGRGGKDETGSWDGLVDEVRIYDYALSDTEVAYLADTTPGDGELYVPIDPAAEIANIYDGEPEGSKWINFKDFAVLANDWLLEETKYPLGP